MERVPRLMGLAAWAILVLGAGMYVTGSHLAAQRFMTRVAGPTSLPAHSDYVSQAYGQRLGNDAEMIARATEILDLAAQREQSKRLRRFFAHCNVQRLLGEDDACTRETVRSAVEKAEGLATDEQWPVDNELASSLNQALSFSLATERQMRDNIDISGFWQYHQYDTPGVLTYDSGKHAFILLAVRNQARWEIARFRAWLTLSANPPIELKCDWNPFPFQWPHPLIPGTEVIRLCQQPERLRLSALLPAVGQAQLDSPSVRLEEFELKSPYVRVTVTAEGDLRRFTLHPVASFTTEFAPDIVSRAVQSDVQRELKQVSCATISSCPSQGQSMSLAFYEFFQQNYVLLPFLAGVLMGIGIGGLFTRSLLTAGLVATALSICTIAGIALAFQAAGSRAPGESRAWAEWGTLGIAVVAIGALLLWIPGLFLGLLLTKWVARTRALEQPI
jgi:hypothetical protein